MLCIETICFYAQLFFVEKPSKVQVIPIEKYDFSCYD